MGADEDAIAEVREELRLLRDARNKHQRRRWYEREPATTVFAHAVTVCFAVVIGFVLHRCTGEPIVIEARGVQQSSGVETAVASSPSPAPAASSESVTAVFDFDAGTVRIVAEATSTAIHAAPPAAPARPRPATAPAAPAAAP